MPRSKNLMNQSIDWHTVKVELRIEWSPEAVPEEINMRRWKQQMASMDERSVRVNGWRQNIGSSQEWTRPLT
ncbi:unnamed protein product [Acanthocheilonema viteae]|uniref:Uncharacterized protein n=1 Tax=Acanthocheilonema viteae TaxID=6277 RepID=A0A498RZT9_ACAVI|nr:unnamed protein product [Acanthocheilonema viteae]